jgi:glycine cleavage system H lipoate-binding protein
MKASKSVRKELYYTKDDEWIDFHGTVAYAGVCNAKLAGVRQIKKITFKSSGFKRRGDIIAVLQCKELQVLAHMPVDGKVLEVNEKLINGNPNILLDCAESSAWIVLIAPSMPHERTDLLLPKQYQMNGKSKYAK